MLGLTETPCGEKGMSLQAVAGVPVKQDFTAECNASPPPHTGSHLRNFIVLFLQDCKIVPEHNICCVSARLSKIISGLIARDPHTFATPLLWVKRNEIGSGEIAGESRWLNGGAFRCALDRLDPGTVSI